MSLERNLILSVCAVLLLSLFAGAALTYEQAVSRVRTEMKAALAVGQRVVQNAIDDSAEQPDPSRRLARIVGAFNGDRHLRAVLTDPRGAILMQSGLQPPDDPAPRLFLNLVSGPKRAADTNLPASLRTAGSLKLETDSRNEVSEAWGDVKRDLSILVFFFTLVLALVMHTLRGALRPLQDLCAALTRIGAGDYAARLAWAGGQELAEVQRGFNAMAERLAEMELQNRLLQSRVRRVQEEERGELARDLHDEVAPFLFAVSADASLIRQYAASGNLQAIDARAEGILTSVAHMQLHLRRVLQRLMPDVLLDLGLAGAIDALVHFWKTHRPDIAFSQSVGAVQLDDRGTEVAFRVVQESLSNAVRHANPGKIDIRVDCTDAGCVVEVADNGTGLPQGPARGLGLIGMRERVHAIGGRFSVASGSTGVAVRAVLASAQNALAAL